MNSVFPLWGWGQWGRDERNECLLCTYVPDTKLGVCVWYLIFIATLRCGYNHPLLIDKETEAHNLPNK